MRKFIYAVLFAMLALQIQAHAQTVIKRCADGSTIGGNSLCPEEQRRQSYPIFGAIAHANGTNVFAARVKAGSYDGAANGARRDCKNETGVNCRIVLYMGQECGAVAVGPKYFSANTASSIEDAEERALLSCRGADNHDCKIKNSMCSY